MEVKRKAESYIRRLSADKRQEVNEAMAKIEQNPYRDQRRWAIRRLRGKLRRFWEFKAISSLRVIYEIVNTERRQIIVRKVTSHL